ncbi:MAG: hypothetical protein LUO95_03140 [Methylococcaceae bacterium]|nr:hypothetical protein [Methylococcaceae bacterium]MDD1615525.1 hypothetical protein [Methylococcaceae bacterium]OYV20113.1 MAG: Uncharacterized protein CG439_612 [Methylococcaceae bacterium NSP1-2]
MNKILCICLTLMLNACVVDPLYTHYGSYGYSVGVVSGPYYYNQQPFYNRYYQQPFYNRYYRQPFYNRHYQQPFYNRSYQQPFYNNPSRGGNWGGGSHGGYRRH